MADVDDPQAANVVHVAAAKLPFRVDSTTQLRRGSLDDDVELPTVSARVPWNPTTAYMANCDGGTEPLGCCLHDSSVVGLAPPRPDAAGNSVMAASKPVSSASPIDGGGGGGDTLSDDMVTFRAALDAVDPSAMVGLRRARSKSVLVPVCRPPAAAARFRARGSVHGDQVTTCDDTVNMVDGTQERRQHQRIYQQQPAKSSQTSATYSKERFRSSSLATQRSRRSRDSTTMSEMCLEYMRLNGIIPRYPSRQQHDDGTATRSRFVILQILLSFDSDRGLPKPHEITIMRRR